MPSSRSPIAVKLDNLIRSRLRVSNPYDPIEVADGLTRFFRGAAERTRIEEAGLPFYQVQVVQPPRPETAGPSRFELDQARSDVSKDLDSLLQNQLTKDIVPELRGWQSAIDNIIADGAEAAPLSLDPRMRDRGFQARRLLGDYARIARFVGALTPAINDNFRALARSLDEVSAVFMVLMGDAIANVGFSGGFFLLQAQASDLQDRRDAVLVALRNLIGSTQVSLDQGTWPRGLQAYQQFINSLDATGNSDLRALFVEANLAKLMDDLIARVNVMSADGLRALGSTAALQVQPLRRLIQLGNRLVDPQSPPLAAFLLALQLFVEAFQYSGSGRRLIQIARPSIVNYGLYGIAGPDQTTQRLQQLVIARGNLAVQLDCFLECQCSGDQIRCQVILDKLLYDIDRSIDALSLGTDQNGQGDAERRAFAYGLIIETFLLNNNNNDNIATAIAAAITTVSGTRARDLVQLGSGSPEDIYLKNLASDLAALQAGYAILNQQGNPFRQCLFPNQPLSASAAAAIQAIQRALTDAYRAIFFGGLPPPPGIPPVIPAPLQIPPVVPTPILPPNPANTASAFPPTDFGNAILQELCMQEDAESQWGNLLQTLAPSCFQQAASVNATTIMLVQLTRAIRALAPCGPLNVTIPADIATSLAGLVYREHSEGGRG
ncbi:MAG TPA: hypothetical protein VHT52_03115 [Stellaceae bacterium]|nr:hypothetical protein [Stellaceae bacterium]